MQNTLLQAPTGDFYFGFVQERVAKDFLVEEGPVVLRYGFHRGTKGFGALHIWERHAVELEPHGVETFEDIPNYIARIITGGTDVLCEFDAIRRDPRYIAVRGALGGAVLEKRFIQEIGLVYSVVSAYPRPHRQGQRVTRIINAPAVNPIPQGLLAPVP